MPPNTRYAQGKAAWGECARSGRKMLLKDMVQDPRTGFMVDPDYMEYADPRPPRDIYDGVQLLSPAPELSPSNDVTIFLGDIVNPATGDLLRPLVVNLQVGTVTVLAS